MSSDPVEIALRHVSETRRMVETLLTASESFDYFQAKAVLEQLRIKVKILARVEAELATARSPLPEIVVRFPSTDQQGA